MARDTSTICVRFDQLDRTRLEAVARDEGESSLSDFVRSVMNDYVQNYLDQNGQDAVVMRYLAAKTEEAQVLLRRTEALSNAALSSPRPSSTGT